MTFDEHVEATRQPDGTYDLAEAQKRRAEELMTDVGMQDLANKAAAQERRQWERSNAERLGKMHLQLPLSPELDRELKVKIGDSVVVRVGDLNHDRIALRLDLRTSVHVRELRAYTAEYDWLKGYRDLLGPEETIDDLYEDPDSA